MNTSTPNEEEDAYDSNTIFYLPPNKVEEVLVQVTDVGPAKLTSIFEMVEIDDEELEQLESANATRKRERMVFK